MISRTTVVGALVVVELGILGLAGRSLHHTGGHGFAGHPHGLEPPGMHWGTASADAAGAGSGLGPLGPGTVLDRTFATSAAPHVTVDVDDVRVVVSGGGGSAVRVVETQRKSGYVSGSFAPLRAEQTPDGVRITEAAGNATMHVMFGSFNRELRVSVPAGAYVEARAGDGALFVAGLRERVSLHTTDGAITLRAHRGDVDASTADGRLTLDDVVAERLVAKTQDGSVRGSGVLLADGSIQTGDGSVRLAVSPQSDATVTLRTGDGKIRVASEIAAAPSDQNDDHARVVHLGTGRGHFTITTVDGSIHLSPALSQGTKV